MSMTSVQVRDNPKHLFRAIQAHTRLLATIRHQLHASPEVSCGNKGSRSCVGMKLGKGGGFDDAGECIPQIWEGDETWLVV